MSTGGLSKAWLARLHDVMAGYVERGEVPGIVSLVSRRCEVHVDAIGMKDTGISVPAKKLDRLATCYKVAPETGVLELYDGVDDSQWSSPPAFPDAGRDLVSTIDDYLAEGQMMLKEWKRGSARPVQTFGRDHDDRPADARAEGGSGLFLGDNRGWGFGVSMVTKRDDVASVPGRFGWDGGLGTSWYSDPQEDMVAMLMTQCLGFPSGIDLDFWTSTYQAIDD